MAGLEGSSWHYENEAQADVVIAALEILVAELELVLAEQKLLAVGRHPSSHGALVRDAAGVKHRRLARRRPG